MPVELVVVKRGVDGDLVTLAVVVTWVASKGAVGLGEVTRVVSRAVAMVA